MSEKFQLELDGVAATFRVMKGEAPATAEMLAKQCPIKGMALHTRWCGPAFFILLEKGAMQGLPLENRRHVFPPGSIVCLPQYDEILITYGDALLRNGVGGDGQGSLVGTIEGDLSPLAAKARLLLLEGAKPLVMRAA